MYPYCVLDSEIRLEYIQKIFVPVPFRYAAVSPGKNILNVSLSLMIFGFFVFSFTKDLIVKLTFNLVLTSVFVRNI